MAAFADYDYYKQHGGKLSEAAYKAVVDDAHAEILSQTNGAADTAPDAMQDAVKLCECKLVDCIAGYGETAGMLPKGVTSVTNDKFSVSVGSASSDGSALVRAEAQERHAICVRYLQWPVNLMCRWL